MRAHLAPVASAPNVSRFPQAPRRKVEATMLTEIGWIHGSIMLPKLNSLVDYLNTTDGFLKVTHVALTGLETPLRFLALSQAGYTLIVPKSPDDRLRSARMQPDQKHSTISCIFKNGWISGTLETSRMIRVSDFLTASNRFFLIKDCELTAGESHTRLPLAIVNGNRVIGITEPSIEEAKAGSGPR